MIATVSLGRGENSMTYIITIYQQRPSGHKITILHETLTCPHARKHIKLLTHLLDVIAYDCGVDQTEFKELAGRVERIKELVALLWSMPRRRPPEPLGEREMRG